MHKRYQHIHNQQLDVLQPMVCVWVCVLCVRLGICVSRCRRLTVAETEIVSILKENITFSDVGVFANVDFCSVRRPLTGVGGCTPSSDHCCQIWRAHDRLAASREQRQKCWLYSHIDAECRRSIERVESIPLVPSHNKHIAHMLTLGWLCLHFAQENGFAVAAFIMIAICQCESQLSLAWWNQNKMNGSIMPTVHKHRTPAPNKRQHYRI